MRSRRGFGVENALDGSLTHAAHWWVAFGVVPAGAHGLLQRPCLAAFPFEIVAAQTGPQRFPWASVEQVPGADQIQGRVGGAKTSDIEHTRESPVAYQYVPWCEISVSHNIGGGPRQLAQTTPQSTQTRNIDEAVAAIEACGHPLVVIAKVSAASSAGELSTGNVDSADLADELGEIRRKSVRCCWVLQCGRCSGQPGLHGPRQRVSSTWLSDGNRRGHGHAGATV